VCILPYVKLLYSFAVEAYLPSFLACSYSTVVECQLALCNVYSMIMLGCDNVVGIATRYVLGGSGIESRCERIVLHFSKPTLGTTQT
jgi:hypothetical protein